MPNYLAGEFSDNLYFDVNGDETVDITDVSDLLNCLETAQSI